ncbi:MAG: c(7)-type cytochrome triheme domain-containing protein [Nitrospirota bacterium]
MRLKMLLLVTIIAVAFVGSAMAVGPGKTVEYPDGDQGKVIFSGDTHSAKQGMKCTDCHPKPFAMKKGSFKMTKEGHGKAEYCGICHDGKKAFSQSTEADCGKCHKKAEVPAEAPAAPAPEAPAAPAPEAPTAPAPAK